MSPVQSNDLSPSSLILLLLFMVSTVHPQPNLEIPSCIECRSRIHYCLGLKGPIVKGTITGKDGRTRTLDVDIRKVDMVHAKKKKKDELGDMCCLCQMCPLCAYTQCPGGCCKDCCRKCCKGWNTCCGMAECLHYGCLFGGSPAGLSLVGIFVLAAVGLGSFGAALVKEWSLQTQPNIIVSPVYEQVTTELIDMPSLLSRLFRSHYFTIALEFIVILGLVGGYFYLRLKQAQKNMNNKQTGDRSSRSSRSSKKDNKKNKKVKPKKEKDKKKKDPTNNKENDKKGHKKKVKKSHKSSHKISSVASSASGVSSTGGASSGGAISSRVNKNSSVGASSYYASRK